MEPNQIWSTIGVSEDIIEASWQALADSFQFKLDNEEKIATAHLSEIQ
jgi:2-isopropylmalate synthase